MNDIESWNEVPDGGIVVEDCYPEVYEIFSRDSKRWLRQIGWMLPAGRARPLPKEIERAIDFDPQPYMDQPWFYLPGSKPADFETSIAKD